MRIVRPEITGHLQQFKIQVDDKAADSNKPNQISYTFKVNKPADNTVTFKDGNATHATVKVENGKSIDNDALA